MLRNKAFMIVIALVFSFSAEARIWRINNIAGVQADFTTASAAVNSSSVVAGDTLYFESSPTDYQGISLSKRLVFIGVGYYLDPSNSGLPGNAGLQATTDPSYISSIFVQDGASGSKFMGITVNSINISPGSTPVALTIEKCLIQGGIFLSNANHSNIVIRKCFFNNARLEGTSGSITNFTCENSIFYNTFSYINLPALSGNTNIFRNNSMRFVGIGLTIPNCYIANNIFGTNQLSFFTNSSLKNNFFETAQTLPPTATNNQVSVDMNTIYLPASGSTDGRMQLKSGSPAIGAGLTVGSVVSPDCGAFGATDPYKLSGIPNIPTIYSLTVPVTIPAGTATMNVTLSTRNNN